MRISLAKILAMWYVSFMKSLEQLESGIVSLLDKLVVLKEENSRLKAENSVLAEKNAALEEEFKKLKDVVEEEENLRAEILRRVNALIRRIQANDSLE